MGWSTAFYWRTITLPQHEITEKSDLLDEKGHLKQVGWARQLLLSYDKKKISARWYRIKEWDYYAVLTPNYGFTLTVAELGILRLVAVVWLDFTKGTFHSAENSKLLSRGKTHMPSTSDEGDVVVKSKRTSVTLVRKTNIREINVLFRNFQDKNDLEAHLVLSQDPSNDTIVIATPWAEKPKKFYYNQKINCMPASGTVTIGSDQYNFDPEESFGVLDWGRGNWTYKNTWYWGSASGKVGESLVGWNIGYGFSDRSKATENIVFYNGVGHKLDQVEFCYNRKNYLEPWTITSNDGRFEMNFTPIVDRNSVTNLLLFKSVQHQVFGIFSGFFILDDGQKIEVEHLLGFAEDVFNRW